MVRCEATFRAGGGRRASRWWVCALGASLAGCGTNYEKILALDGDAVKGQILYESNCGTCHGDDGTGVTGPALTDVVPVLTSTEILETIETGPGAMPDFSDYFTDQQLADLLEYVTTEFR